MTAFKIFRITMADRPLVVKFLREAFFKHRVLNIAMGMTGEPSKEEINNSLQSLPQGYSLLAVSSDDKILGVNVNCEITDNEANLRRKLLEECTNKDLATFLRFWLHVERSANFWKYTDETKAFESKIMAVDFKARGLGVGNGLASRMFETAKEEGYKIVRADCSSYYAAKMAERQGMKCVFELKYKDYKDENGNVIFKVPAPHDAFRIFMKKL